MSHDPYGNPRNPGYGPGWTGAGPQPGAGWGPGWGAGPQAGPQTGERTGRIDLLDVVEGVMRDGFSLSNFTRIARASGSNFWVGAAIGASAVVLARRPDVRAALGGIFKGHDAGEPR